MVKNYKAHVFVCTNERPSGESCRPKGSAELREALKARCKNDPALHGKARINAAGCLGQCEQGIAAVIYPQGEWVLNLEKENGVEELFQKVVNAVSLED